LQSVSAVVAVTVADKKIVLFYLESINFLMFKILFRGSMYTECFGGQLQY